MYIYSKKKGPCSHKREEKGNSAGNVSAHSNASKFLVRHFFVIMPRVIVYSRRYSGERERERKESRGKGLQEKRNIYI